MALIPAMLLLQCMKCSTLFLPSLRWRASGGKERPRTCRATLTSASTYCKRCSSKLSFNFFIPTSAVNGGYYTRSLRKVREHCKSFSCSSLSVAVENALAALDLEEVKANKLSVQVLQVGNANELNFLLDYHKYKGSINSSHNINLDVVNKVICNVNNTVGHIDLVKIIRELKSLPIASSSPLKASTSAATLKVMPPLKAQPLTGFKRKADQVPALMKKARKQALQLKNKLSSDIAVDLDERNNLDFISSISRLKAKADKLIKDREEYRRLFREANRALIDVKSEVDDLVNKYFSIAEVEDL